MTVDQSVDPQTVAVTQFERFGLSSYAARTFVALISPGTGTAKDVSRVADVPRTRVYDAVEELHERGLVGVRKSTPKQFLPVSAQTAGRKFEREMRQRSALLRTALDDLEPATAQTEQRGVWTIESNDAIPTGSSTW